MEKGREAAARNSALTAILRSRLYKQNIITLSHVMLGDEPAVKQVILRLNFQCGQKCGFCYNVIHPEVSPQEAGWAIEKIIKAFVNIDMFSFSGGEPGFCLELENHIKNLKRGSMARVDIQTNAIPFSDAALARKVAAAGLDSALASLHGHNASVCDAVTRDPGAFDKTVSGIKNLLEAGVDVHINHVINPLNQDHIKEFAQMAATEFPGVLLCVSVAQPFVFFPQSRMKSIPRYSDFADNLRDALDWCLENEVEFSGLHEACGLPLCILGVERGYFKYFHNVSAFEDQSVNPDAVEFVKPPACDPCALKSRCFGVRRMYAAHYGTDELKPVKEI